MEKYIKQFYDDMNKGTSRYKSWEHCYFFFKDNYTKINTDESLKDLGALHLAFYLASWGMYRGSSFLLQQDYKIHIPVVSILCKEKYYPLFKNTNIDKLIELKNEIAEVYKDNKPSDTLISKIILGTNGSIVAYDRYAKNTLKGIKCSQTFNKKSVDSLLSLLETKDFSNLRKDCEGLQKYPDMKLLDMYLFQKGLKEDTV